MPDWIPHRAIERGEGYWCYYTVAEPDESVPIKQPEEEFDDLPVYEDQLVYRPVTVDISDDGEVYAYFYDRDADWESLKKRGGKVFVPTQQVHATPLPNAEPAYEYESSGREDTDA